jgi:hypothetical protein
MNSNSLLPPVPVRFSADTRERLHRTAKRFNLKASVLIRQAVDSKLPEWEASGTLTIQSRRPLRKAA